MATFQVAPKLILVGTDDSDVFSIETELSCFRMLAQRVMYWRRVMVKILFQFGALVC